MPRQASDDSTSVGRKCLRANVVLPDPLGPIRTTRDRFGMEIFIIDSLPSQVWAAGSPLPELPPALAFIWPRRSVDHSKAAPSIGIVWVEDEHSVHFVARFFRPSKASARPRR